MDYDIFIMLRVVEFRKMGWSDRASVCLAVERSGSIVTAAGIIMSISFAGLLGASTVVLNQYGFILFIGVAIDTFLIRTIVVPAVFTVLSGSRAAFALVLPPKLNNDDNPAALNELESNLNTGCSTRNKSSSILRRRAQLVFSSRWDIKHIETNWWPSIMPEQILTDDEEDDAMFKSFVSPVEYLQMKYSEGAGANSSGATGAPNN